MTRYKLLFVNLGPRDKIVVDVLIALLLNSGCPETPGPYLGADWKSPLLLGDFNLHSLETEIGWEFTAYTDLSHLIFPPGQQAY